MTLFVDLYVTLLYLGSAGHTVRSKSYDSVMPETKALFLFVCFRYAYQTMLPFHPTILGSDLFQRASNQNRTKRTIFLSICFYYFFDT